MADDLISKPTGRTRIVSEFLSRLCRAGQSQSLEELWAGALPWFCELTRAQGGTVFLLEPAMRVTHGELPEAALLAIEAWEAQVSSLRQWVAPGSAPVSASPAIPPPRVAAGEVIVRGLPLWREGALVGGLCLAWQAGRRVTNWPAVAALGQTLFHLMVTCQSVQDIRRRLTHMTLLYEVGQKLTSTLDLNVVLNETMTLAAHTLDAEAATLLLVDEERSELVFEIPVGGAGGMLRQQRIPLSQGIAGWVATHAEPVIANQVGADQRFNSQVDARTGFTTRSILAVPLQVKGRVIGVLEVLNKRGGEGFSEEDLEWLSTLGAQAAIAIENARLYESLRQEQERILRVQEQERHALAQDLHDGPTAMLGMIIMNLDHARRLARTKPERLEEELDRLVDLARLANRELRQKLFELRPVVLQTRGLLAALRFYAGQLGDKLPYRLHLDLPESLPDLVSEMAEAVFAIIQEAINNVTKHARAENCWLRVRVDDGRQLLVVEVEDDGVGFDPQRPADGEPERISLGMLGMRERADRLGASFTVQSPPRQGAHGTLVRLEVPLSRLMAPAQAGGDGVL